VVVMSELALPADKEVVARQSQNLRDLIRAIGRGEIEPQVEGPDEPGFFAELVRELRALGGSLNRRIADLESNISQLSQQLQQANEQLAAFNALEERVKERTTELFLTNKRLHQEITDRIEAEASLRKRIAELKVAAEVGTAATILNRAELIHTAVELIKVRFGLSYVHIFLLDHRRTRLKLAAAAGEIGQQLVADHPSILLDQPQSLIARAARTKQPVVANNVLMTPDYLPHPLLPDTQAELAVPMMVGEEVLGVLDIQSAQLNSFSDDDVSIHTILAGQIANALRNATLFENVSQSQQETAALYKVAQAMAQLTDEQPMFELVLATYLQNLNFKQGGVLLIDPDSRQSQLVALVRNGEFAKPGFQVPTAGNPSLAHLIETKKPVVINNAGDDPLLAPVRYLVTELGIKSMLLVPIILRQEVIGALGVDATETSHTFSDREIALVQAMADQLGIGLENRRLLEKMAARTKELHQAQERLIRQEKLAVLGKLAGGVGHELRNPLGVIANAVYFLRLILPEADDTVQEYLGIIETRLFEAEKIISDLLSLSRTRPAERQAVLISTVLADSLKNNPAPEMVQVVIDVAADLPLVFIDPQQIGQVLTNLITNAYQAMPEGGTLSVRARLVAEQLQLSLSDTGLGMPAEVQEKIFEPLFTTKANGIGLGLVVSKNLVEVNGGLIEVKSTAGQGTTFMVNLPLKTAAKTEASQA
jgi:signal transduction histidine kinase